MIDGVVQRDSPLRAQQAAAAYLYRRKERESERNPGSGEEPTVSDPSEKAKVSEVMTRDVKTLPAEASVDDGLSLMDEYGFNHIPLVDNDGCLIGLVSDRDLYLSLDIPEASLSEFMTSRLITSSPGTLLKDAARVLLQEKISSLPVIDETRKPVGLVTMADILGYLVSHPAMRLWA